MRLLKVYDVAEILNCSPSEVYALKDAGLITYCHIRGMIRFQEEDVREFITASVVMPAPRRPNRRVRMPQLRHPAMLAVALAPVCQR